MLCEEHFLSSMNSHFIQFRSFNLLISETAMILISFKLLKTRWKIIIDVDCTVTFDLVFILKLSHEFYRYL